MQSETYISVDVETAGPTPENHALLSIGACLVEDPTVGFYVELQPDRPDSTPEALAIHGLSLQTLRETGVPPTEAMQAFADWVQRVVPAGSRPVFVALNAPFDWMFVNIYFYRYLGANPFGHSALDIKAYFMGMQGGPWSQTSLKHISAHLLQETHLSHNALSDAQDQAQIFHRMLEREIYQTLRVSSTLRALLRNRLRRDIMTETTDKPQAELERILESARRLGVEVEEGEALQWLAQMAASKEGDEITLDTRTGVFGHNITMLDFSDKELEYFRRVGKIVEFEDVPGQIETALALSGSSAQSKIQTYPGDCDYFERINILAPTREEACRILAQIMREKALQTLRGPNYQLIEVKFGSYPKAMVVGNREVKAGAPASWKPDQVQAGKIEGFTADGSPAVVEWESLSAAPGWCKLDWVVADPIRKQLANASNMLDVTWEAPDGAITPLDGYLDPYFQEVYLEATSVPIFSKLAQHVSANALDQYVLQLENEVKKYLTKDINYGKVAKRMYNIFRLTGRYEEAAFLRELFDEPATLLYQVWSLIRTIDDAYLPESSITYEQMVAATDRLIMDVIRTLEGVQEAEIVSDLLRLRDALSRPEAREMLTVEAEAARGRVINVVNNFFYERLNGMPAIREYMRNFQASEVRIAHALSRLPILQSGEGQG